MSEESVPSQEPTSENKPDKELIHSDNVIPDEVEAMLEGLPEAQQKAVKAILIGVSHQSIWRGPLPPPEVLKQYNEAFPNGAERIFKEAQKQTDHRISLEKHAIPENLRQSAKGQIFGFIIALAFLIASFILVYTGHDVAGTIMGTVDIAALVAIFVYGRNTQKKTLEE